MLAEASTYNNTRAVVPVVVVIFQIGSNSMKVASAMVPPRIKGSVQKAPVNTPG